MCAGRADFEDFDAGIAQRSRGAQVGGLALGWRGQEVEQTIFYQAGGIAIVLWGRDQLADDAEVAPVGPPEFAGVAMAQNVRTPEEVDDVLNRAAAAGATITKPAARTFYGGYAGYFRDPGGHLWEVAHNPGFQLAADGSLTLPDFGG